MNSYRHGKSTLRRENLLGLYLGLFILVLSLSPGSIQISLWMDDYPFLWGMVGEDPTALEFMLGSSRPILALLMIVIDYLSFNFVLFSYLKVIGFLGIVVAYIMIAGRWNRLGFPRFMIPIAAVGFCLPTFQTYSFWASAFTYSWAPVLSILSLNLWERRVKKFRFMAVFLFSLSFLIYPPGAFFIFGLIAVEFWISRCTTPMMAKKTLDSLILASIGTSISLAIFYVYTFLLDLEPNQRYELVQLTELPAKLSWYFTRVLVSSFRPFQVSSPTTFEAILSSLPVIVILTLGIYQRFRLLRNRVYLHAILLFFPLAISSIHTLAVKENQFEFRFFPGQMWGTLAISSYLVLQAIDDRWQKKYVRLITLISAPFMAFLVIVKPNLIFQEIIKRPYEIKTMYLSQLITDCRTRSQNAPILLEIIPSAPKFLDNLGSYSIFLDSYFDWVLRPEIALLQNSDDYQDSKKIQQGANRDNFPRYSCPISVKEIERRIEDAE